MRPCHGAGGGQAVLAAEQVDLARRRPSRQALEASRSALGLRADDTPVSRAQAARTFIAPPAAFLRAARSSSQMVSGLAM